MKSNYPKLFTAVFILFCVTGCGLADRVQNAVTGSGKTNSNKTLSDKGVDTVVGEETTGVPECDEVMEMLAAEANNPDDNFVTKAIKATFLNKIKESIKKSIDENKNKKDTADLAKTCTDFKRQLEKYKAEDEKKKNP